MTGLSGAQAGRALCLAGAAIAAIGLIGYLVSAEPLYTIIPGQLAMLPNAAIGLLLLGIAGTLRAQAVGGPTAWLPALAAMFVLVFALGSLAQDAFGVELGLDQLFIHTEAGTPPGRFSPTTAVMFVLLSTGILFFHSSPHRRVRPSDWLILSAGIVAFIALLGQIFGAGPLYMLTRAPIIGVAIPTVTSGLMISAGLLLQKADTGLMSLISGRGPGSMLLQRLAPWAILAPVAFGLIAAYLLAMPAGFDAPMAYAAMLVLIVVVSLFLLSITAASLNRTHELLERERADARNLFDMASDGIFVADTAGRFTEVNQSGCRMLGYSREEIIGKTIVDMIRPEDVDRLWQDRARFLEGQVGVSEWLLRRKDGSLLPVEISAKILPDGRWQAFDRDISERKRAEEAIRLSEAKLSGIVSQSSDAIISIDDSQRVTLFNEGAEKMFGRASAAMIGRPLDDLLPERFRPLLPGSIAEFAASAENARPLGTVTGLRSNGEEFPADASISKISLGATTIMTATLRDVTIQKRFERVQRIFGDLGAALATLEFDALLTNMARLLVNELADLCIVDLLQEDRAARRVKVMCREEAFDRIADVLVRLPSATGIRLAKSIEQTTEPVLIADLTPAAIEAFAWGEGHREAIEQLGAKCAIQVPLRVHGTIVGRLSLLSSQPNRRYDARDVRLIEAFAERAALSLQNARLYEAARRATKARDDILGIVAHDLRNPLQAIMLDAAVLSRAQPEIAEEISTSSERMSRLIQDLVDVSSLEAGHLSMRPDRVDPVTLVAASVAAEAPIASSASVTLRSEVQKDVVPVWADRDRLLQVFDNLIANAIKFTPADGRITIGAEGGEAEVTFWVRDTGSGIAEDHLPHVFDRFWQGARSARKGAGLGLTIVRGIVEAHGGRVWVESAPGQGSTFHFTVPAAPAEPAGTSQQGQRA